MKARYRIISSILALAMLLPNVAVVSSAADTAEQKATSIRNDYLEFSINKNTGFFSVATLGGHPQKTADDNMKLLYDGDSIETSFTTVRIDGTDYIFGQEYGIFGLKSDISDIVADAVNNTLTVTWTLEDISVTQKAYLSRTDNTSTTGNVRVEYQIVNTSATESHEVGLRVMLDNALGEIDAPITMAQRESAPVAKEAEFFTVGSDGTIRDPGMYVRFMDSYESPSKEAYINFEGLSNPEPDRMIVGHWYNLAASKWDYEPDTDLVFDSGFNKYGTADTATALYWGESEYAPGERFTPSVTYGVGDFTANVKDAMFNIALNLEGELEYGSDGQYIDDIYDATLYIYNNVDGSVDIENAVLTLNCDEGLEFLLDTEDGDSLNLTELTMDLGFIGAGTVMTHRFKVRVEEQKVLTPLQVAASVRGNTEDDSVLAVQYILAPGPTAEKFAINIQSIYDDIFHCEGQRVMSVFGSFPVDLLVDKTKWAAAFVKKDNPNVRYEIDMDLVNFLDTGTMSVRHEGKMELGEYVMELAFFGEYEEIFGNTYTSSAFITIKNDPSLTTSQYGYVIVFRTGLSAVADYKIASFKNTEEMKAFEANVAAQANGTYEKILMIEGVFEKIKDNHEDYGYVSLGDVTINEVLTAKEGTTVGLFYNDGYKQGVRVMSDDTLRGKDSVIFNTSWKIEVYDGRTHSLTDKSISVEKQGAVGYLIDVLGGAVDLQFGVLGIGEPTDPTSEGYYVSFGGTFVLSGYPKNEEGNYYTQTPDVNRETGYASSYATPEALKVNKTAIYASAAIDDVIYDRNGYQGINTTLEIALSAANILRATRKDSFGVKLYINTYEHEGSGTASFSIGKYGVELGIGFAIKEINKRECFLLNDLKAQIIVPPTNPIPLWPPFLSLTQAGAELKDLADIVDVAQMSHTEAVEAVSNMTTSLSMNAGFLFVQLLVGTGIFSVTPHSVDFSVTLTTPALPGLSNTTFFKLDWRIPVKDESGNVLIPVKIAGTMSQRVNAFNIIIASAALNLSFTGPMQSSSPLDLSEVLAQGLSAALQLYGCASIPPLVPVLGGMELASGTGILSTVGLSMVFEFLNIELGFTYGWGDEDVVSIYSVDDRDEMIGVNNMTVLKVEETETQESVGYSLRGAAGNAANTCTFEITTAADKDTLIAVSYDGSVPAIEDITFMIGDQEYALTEALMENNYRGGNAAVIRNLGKILISVPASLDGTETYSIASADENVVFTGAEAVALKRSASAESVTIHSDGSVTVASDSSLKGSTVQLYYAEHPELYENIETETLTDADGNDYVKLYFVAADGTKTELTDERIAYINEHCVYTVDVAEDVNAITVPQDELVPDATLHTGEYHIMAAVISQNKKLTKAVSEEVISHVNPNQPDPVHSAELINTGDKTLTLTVNEPQRAPLTYDGYFVSLYDETAGEYYQQNVYFEVGDEISFKIEPQPVYDENGKLTGTVDRIGHSFTAEIETVNLSDNSVVISAESTTTAAVELRTPKTIDVDFVMANETREGIYTLTNGTVTSVDYIIGNTASFTAITEEAVQGGFIVDGMETAMNDSDQLTTRFSYSGAFDEGLHSVAFKALNADGDTTVTESIVFAVNSVAPSVNVESAILLVEDGKVVLRGTAYNTETVTFLGESCAPGPDGTFALTVGVELDRMAERYSVSAESPAGMTSETNVLVVNTGFRPISSVDILADGRSVDKIELEPGETVMLSTVGYADETVRDVSDTAVLAVVKGSNSVVLNGNTLKAVSEGTAYVKLVFDMGTYIADDRTADYVFEDIIEVSVKSRSSAVTASIPNGATVEPGTLLTLSGDGEIYYTTDGSEPTKNSNLYRRPIVLNKSVTIKAICYEDGKMPGSVMTFTYIVEQGDTGKDDNRIPLYPSFGDVFDGMSISSVRNSVITASVPEGKVDAGTAVVLKASGDGNIYYTTDGSTPDKYAAKYTAPIILNEDTVIKAVVWNGGNYYSDVFTFRYQLNAYWVRLKTDLKKSDLMTGYPDGTFRPDARITRAETAALLHRAAEFNGYHVRDDVFADVDMWAKDAINELAAAGIVTGYPDGTFRPDHTVTRAEFVTMLMRLIGQDGGKTVFADVQGHWAEKYIAKAAEYGYISGYPDGTFRPDANITRAEAFKIMTNVFGFEANGTVSGFADVTKDHWVFAYIAE